MAGLSLFVPPATVVPAVLSLEVLASVSLIRGAIPDSERGRLIWLLLGNAVCIPLGIAALVVLPETQVRFLVGGVLLVSATLLKAAGGRSLAPTLGLLAPAMFAGIWIGRRSFHSVNPARYRALVLNLLILISGLGVLRSVFESIRG